MFTRDNQRQYAVLKAMGATSPDLLRMIFAQAGLCAFLGCGIGLGLCGMIGPFTGAYSHFPFRLMWFAPPAALLLVLVISGVAAAISLYPVLKLDPASVFSGR
jgi:putative ABC transport system permease protein